MTLVAQAIPTCAYSPAPPVAAFRYQNWRVILDSKQITIKDIDKEDNVVEVMAYLDDIVTKANEYPGR
jgi:hypothetical protein